MYIHACMHTYVRMCTHRNIPTCMKIAAGDGNNNRNFHTGTIPWADPKQLRVPIVDGQLLGCDFNAGATTAAHTAANLVRRVAIIVSLAERPFTHTEAQH